VELYLHYLNTSSSRGASLSIGYVSMAWYRGNFTFTLRLSSRVFRITDIWITHRRLNSSPHVRWPVAELSTATTGQTRTVISYLFEFHIFGSQGRCSSRAPNCSRRLAADLTTTLTGHLFQCLQSLRLIGQQAIILWRVSNEPPFSNKLNCTGRLWQ
jgi:hypothetical protein